jgi:hypothetical protein
LGKFFANCAVRCALKHGEIAEWRENCNNLWYIKCFKKIFPGDKKYHSYFFNIDFVKLYIIIFKN